MAGAGSPLAGCRMVALSRVPSGTVIQMSLMRSTEYGKSVRICVIVGPQPVISTGTMFEPAPSTR